MDFRPKSGPTWRRPPTSETGIENPVILLHSVTHLFKLEFDEKRYLLRTGDHKLTVTKKWGIFKSRDYFTTVHWLRCTTWFSLILLIWIKRSLFLQSYISLIKNKIGTIKTDIVKDLLSIHTSQNQYKYHFILYRSNYLNRSLGVACLPSSVLRCEYEYKIGNPENRRETR